MSSTASERDSLLGCARSPECNIVAESSFLTVITALQAVAVMDIWHYTPSFAESTHSRVKMIVTHVIIMTKSVLFITTLAHIRRMCRCVGYNSHFTTTQRSGCDPTRLCCTAYPAKAWVDAACPSTSGVYASRQAGEQLMKA